MAIERLYLTGFMTSGKSTIGPILANVLGWDYYDLDIEIEKTRNKRINEIFESEGEFAFREYETKMLTKLSLIKNSVIALGGGAIAFENNFNIISRTGKIVYLKASASAIFKRIKNKTDRPLFRGLVLSESSEDQFLERINEMLLPREKYYMKADIQIDTDKINVGQTVDAIVKQFKKLEHENN